MLEIIVVLVTVAHHIGKAKKPHWMQFNHFQFEIAFKSPQMHFR